MRVQRCKRWGRGNIHINSWFNSVFKMHGHRLSPRKHVSTKFAFSYLHLPLQLSWSIGIYRRKIARIPRFSLPAAAATKSLQSCPTVCDPTDSSPPGSPVPGILQARTLEWVAMSFSNAWKWKVKVKSLSPVRLFETPWTAAYQAPPSMGFSRQEYWSGVPLPSPFHCLRLLKHGYYWI